MFQGYKVVAITPAGRRQYMDVLATYVLRDRGVFDEWHLWVNTGREADLVYLEALAVAYPGFVKLVRYKEPITVPAHQPWYFRHACEPDTLYVKFDDDICWVKEDAVRELLRFRIENPRPLVVLANTINNGYCAYIHAKRGSQEFKINGEYPRIAPDCYNEVWRNPGFGEYVHRTFIDDLLRGDLQKYLFESWPLEAYERFAVNCLCWWGRDVDGEMGGHQDEEAWLTTIRPRELGRPNLICGTSLVSHFAFHKQRKPHCVGREIDERIHDAYRAISRGGDERAVRAAMAKRALL